MQVASLKLCKELYEVSGWGYTYHAYGQGEHDLTDKKWYWFEAKTTGSYWEAIKTDFDDRDPHDNRRPSATTHRMGMLAPAYDAGYLLRKLPSHVSGNLMLETDGTPEDRWCAYYDAMPVTLRSYYNDTPEDALASLSIKLFKQGVLTKSQEETR